MSRIQSEITRHAKPCSSPQDHGFLLQKEKKERKRVKENNFATGKKNEQPCRETEKYTHKEKEKNQ